MLKKIVIIVLTATLVSCASPKVVQVRHSEDKRLDCAKLKLQVDEAIGLEEAARKERGVTGTNVAATLLFWPGLLVTTSNTMDAVDAAKDRQRHLYKIMDDKGCK